MTKLRVLVSCFPYFIDSFIAYDFFILKEKKNEQHVCNFGYDFLI
jgi:hypothetical protein